MVITSSDGFRYPVNGLAASQFPDLPPLEDIWAFHPDPAMADAGFRISIGPLIQAGLALCP
jgi:hypothetical protein